MLCEAPALLAKLHSQDWAGLSGCSRQLRDVIHSSVKAITVRTEVDVTAVLNGNWSKLSLVKTQPSSHTGHESRLDRPQGSNFGVVAFFHASCVRQDSAPLLRFHSSDTTAYIVKATAQQSQLHHHSQLHQIFAAAFSNFQNAGRGQTHSLRISISCHADQLIEHLTLYDWSNMRHLNLSYNQLGSAAVEHLARGSWPQLKQLDLSKNQLDKAAMTALLRGGWPSLVDSVLCAEQHVNSSPIKQCVACHFPYSQVLACVILTVSHKAKRHLHPIMAYGSSNKESSGVIDSMTTGTTAACYPGNFSVSLSPRDAPPHCCKLVRKQHT